MKRTFANLILVAVAAFALAACDTMPTKPEPPTPVVQKSTTDLMLEIRKAELEIERTEQMAWLKFAVESGSDMVKGFVMGRSGAGKAGAAGGGSTAQTVLAAQAQADATALRREELAERNSAWNRGLQLFDRAVPVFGMVQGYRLQKRSQEIAADQFRYTLDAFAGAQQGAYDFSSSVLDQGPYFFSAPLGSTATRLD